VIGSPSNPSGKTHARKEVAAGNGEKKILWCHEGENGLKKIPERGLIVPSMGGRGEFLGKKKKGSARERGFPSRRRKNH